MHGWLVFVVVVLAFIAVGCGLQAYTDKTGRGKAKNPGNYDDTTPGQWGP